MSGWDLRNVVVGVDGSEQSLAAADVAAAAARTHSGVLHVVTVVRPPEGWWGLVGSPPPAEAFTNAMEKAQQAVLDKTVAHIDPAGVEVVTSQELGDPANELLAYCDRVDADLLVVGRRGAGMVERLVLGSVADRIAHSSKRPVLIVP